MKEVTTNSVAMQEPELKPHEPDICFLPDVDIHENQEAITLLADLPGVDQKDVNVSIENGVLTIEASATPDQPEGYTIAGREWVPGKWRRTFQISDRIDVEQISASVKNGVLTLTLPKHETVKTRKIEINT